MFARRPVWALPPKVQPHDVNGKEMEEDLKPPPAYPKIDEDEQANNEKPLQSVVSSGGIHIHHYDSKPSRKSSDSEDNRPPARKPDRQRYQQKQHHQYDQQMPGAVPTVSEQVNRDKLVPKTYPNVIPSKESGAPFVKSFLPADTDPHLSAPEDNILTDYLLRFATGSKKRVPRNTNLKSVLILNKKRRKNMMDDEEGDWDSDEQELEDRMVANHEAIGGDEIQIDAKGGRVFVDDTDQVHVYSKQDNNAYRTKNKELI